MNARERLRGLWSGSGLQFLKFGGFWVTLLVIGLVVGGVLASYTAWDWLRSGADSQEAMGTTARIVGLMIARCRSRSYLPSGAAGWPTNKLTPPGRVWLNERYQKGAEMLGNNVLSVRLGGIYALERLAAEHPEQYHVQIMKLLCAFVRYPTEDEDYQNKLAERNADLRTPYSPREDRRAAMEFIGSRDETRVEIEKGQDFRLNLMGADLSHTRIGDANLSGAMLHYANLSKTEISSVDLSNAYLTGTVMKMARLINIDFTNARALDADLSGATMLQLTMPSLTLDNANLSGAQLNGVDLSGGFDSVRESVQCRHKKF